MSKVCVCIEGQLRTAKKCGPLMKKYMIDRLGADLYLYIQNYKHHNDSDIQYYGPYKHLTVYNNPHPDFSVIFNKLCDEYGYKKNGWKSTFDGLINANYMFGYDAEGTCIRRMYNRYLLYKTLKDTDYDWFIITRSDLYFLHFFPYISTLNEDKLTVFKNCNWGGINNNLIAFHKKNLDKVLNYIGNFLSNSVLNYINKNGLKDSPINEEGFFRYNMNINGVQFDKIDNMTYITCEENGYTTWAKISKSPTGDIYKYKEDYNDSIQYMKNKRDNKLCLLANKYNSDKGTVYKCAHEYTTYYGDLLDYLRLKFNRLRLLELGLNRDDQNDIPSLKIWNDYFEGDIDISGFDICSEFLAFNGKYNNIKIYCGDQSDPASLSQLKDNKYHIIIDDAYHASAHQQISFRELWDSVIPGGVYVIEDLHWQPYHDDDKTKDLLLKWKDGQYIGSKYITGDDIEHIKYSIDRIEFMDSKSKNWNPIDVKNALVFIYKKPKPKVNSFDIFDTLLARKVKTPTDIFKIVEDKYHIPNFYNNRITAERMSNGTYEDIVLKYWGITGVSEREIGHMRAMEHKTELDHLIPIVSNIDKVKAGDILISDMYLDKNAIRSFLRKVGFDKDVQIYVTPNGKSSGYIWKDLLNKYDIELHTGDNYHSDIVMANNNGINTFHTTIHAYTPIENDLPHELATIIREFRLRNPYNETSYEYRLYDEQCRSNIIIMCVFSSKISSILDTEGLDNILFCRRDCCLLEKIFPFLYPKYAYVSYYNSRIMNGSNNEKYMEYVKNIHNDKSLIVDLNGSFSSGREMFMRIKGKLPRVHLLCYNRADSEFDGLTYSCDHNMSDYIELLNSDINGTMIDFANGNAILRENENNREYVNIIHNTIDSFISFIEERGLVDVLRKYSKELSNNQDFCKGLFSEKYFTNIYKERIKNI